MKRLRRTLAWLLVLMLFVPPAALTQGPAPESSFKAEELEQIAAPIALYPDALLAQVLMASTYPLEVVQAARFVKDNAKLKGDQLNAALQDQTWDDSVKSLVSFPQILDLMNQKLDWTQKLGDAFLGQQKELLDAVQRLRARAQAQGNLKSTAEQKVTVEPAAAGAPAPSQTTVVQQAPPTVIKIESASPEVVYVPSYNPTVVYGSWPYPAYPPAYPYPPGYAFGAAALSFGVGMAVGAAVWGNCNWGAGHADVNVSNYQNYTKNVNKSNVASERANRAQQGQAGNRSQWQHSPENRRGVQYRDQATQQKFNRGSNPQAAQSREAFRGRGEQGGQDLGRGGAGGRGEGASRAQGLGAGEGGRGGREAGAFQGMGGGGADARASSSRGQSSRQSSVGAGGGGGGRAAGAGGGGGGSRGGGGGGGGRGGGGGGRR